MFRNYLISAINNLTRHKLYSAINIVGLAIGLAACILIGLYVLDETSFDKQWDDSGRIYRLNFTFTIPGRDPLLTPRSPFYALPTLAGEFPDAIEYRAREFGFDREIRVGEQTFNEHMGEVDPDLLNIFQFELLAGSFEETFSAVSNIALSESIATRFFGAADPIGQVMTIDKLGEPRDYRVTAIYRILGNTVLDLPMLALLDDATVPPPFKNWFNEPVRAYFKLKPEADIAVLAARAEDFINRNSDIAQYFPDAGLSAADLMQMHFQNVETLHLESPFDRFRDGGNKQVVMLFTAISLLVLLVGCINFTTLTTAKAIRRAREVSMRKVVGAKRKQLIVQFLAESGCIVAIAMFLGLGLVELALPVFESLVGRTLDLDFSVAGTWVSLVILFFVVGLCGGLYPAFVLSGFRPAGALKDSQFSESRSTAMLRYTLVVFQFSVAIVLIIAAAVILAQLQYSMNRDPGYDSNNLLLINQLGARPGLADRIAPLNQALLANAGISEVAVSNAQPSERPEVIQRYTVVGESSGDSQILSRMIINDEFIPAYRIPVVTGRNFDRLRDLPDPAFDINAGQADGDGQDATISRSILLNVSAVREMGFASPEAAVGRVINTNTRRNINYTIIGVVADNHFYSINALPRAEVYIMQPGQADVLTIRYRGSPEVILEQVTDTWRSVMGDAELSTVFVDQLLAAEFEQELLEVRIILGFSLLSIIIACLGLYGTAAFTVDRRVKEIGLRKVMGARVRQIVSLLIWQFTKPVLLANVIAWPIATYAMLQWLERFPYQLAHWYLAPLCVGAGLVALVIAWFTVAGNTLRVARSNPIIALRYE